MEFLLIPIKDTKKRLVLKGLDERSGPENQGVFLLPFCTFAWINPDEKSF
jgi:hypothetical protein